jgi:hypothetical protein
MNYINEELIEKAERLRKECDDATAYQFLIDVIKLELKQSKRSGSND